ncbi:uncharacterized protein LOC130671525 [Microplitis mediator]|uniref:uncharacterized protein LOC130671525 n=1 Tax=Microplitis mediator TaxID=375433 RepID=UPI0025531211|nr:uncharacterized protein LOC130671525 [Microplitis mediator]
MIFLNIFFLIITCQIQPSYQKDSGKSGNRAHSLESETVIENKNVNIVVNVDPKDVAKELWKIIEKRMDNPPSRRSQLSHDVIRELENIVTPIVIPSRRKNEPSAFEIADALDHVTRKALKDGSKERSSMEDEILTRNIVANMMKTLHEVQTIESKYMRPSESVLKYGQTRKSLKTDDDSNSNSNSNESVGKDEDDDYVKLLFKVRKNMLLKTNSLQYVFN